MPFLLVYLHRVRGIELGIAGLALSSLALAGFVGNPVGGWLADRVGARRALVAGLVVAAAGTASIVGVRVAWQAFAACALYGLGAAIIWPAQDTLLAGVVHADRRSAAFSVRHATMNAGMGVGGLLAAIIAKLADPATFVTLYLLDAATFLAFVPVVLVGLRGRGGPAPRQPAGTLAPAARGPIATVLADRAFRRLWVLTAMLVAIGYGQIYSAFPAFATRPGGISVGALGLTLTANTLGVVGFQLAALRLMAGWRRSAGLALTSLCWALAWVVTLVAGRLGAGVGAVAVFVLAASVFAVGETFLSPSLQPLVNDLAPDELRGRYNGLSTLAWTTGFALGPAVAGVTLGFGDGSPLFVGLALAALVAAVGSLRLSAHLPPGVDLVPRFAAEPEAMVSSLAAKGT